MQSLGLNVIYSESFKVTAEQSKDITILQRYEIWVFLFRYKKGYQIRYYVSIRRSICCIAWQVEEVASQFSGCLSYFFSLFLWYPFLFFQRFASLSIVQANNEKIENSQFKSKFNSKHYQIHYIKTWQIQFMGHLEAIATYTELKTNYINQLGNQIKLLMESVEKLIAKTQNFPRHTRQVLNLFSYFYLFFYLIGFTSKFFSSVLNSIAIGEFVFL